MFKITVTMLHHEAKQKLHPYSRELRKVIQSHDNVVRTIVKYIVYEILIFQLYKSFGIKKVVKPVSTFLFRKDTPHFM